MRFAERNLRRIVTMLLLLLSAWRCAGAERMLTLLPDPQDRAAQHLAVMSQRDEVFEGLLYNGGYLSAKGCQPICVANAVIAAFDVQDRQKAADLVKEASQVLVIEQARGTGRMELSRIETLLNVQDRTQQAKQYPQLAATIGGYGREIAVSGNELNAQTVCDYFAQRQTGMLAGRLTVYPDWTALLEIAQQLVGMGLGNARLCLASVSAGSEPSGMPFGSGKGGHYLTLMMHADTFVSQGRIYVLDSLPRALKGEESGYTRVLRKPYPFAMVKTGLAASFEASRISETIIRLTIRDAAAWQDADIKEKAKMLQPVILYGPGILLITAS